MAVKRKGAPILREENKLRDENEDADTDTEESSESEQDEEVQLSEPSKTAIYNAEAILDKLADIRWPEDADWIHRLSVEGGDVNVDVDVNDDLSRELFFYNQSLVGAREAFSRLEARGLPFLRPADYYAEMVKTDGHMEKVKSRLLFEKRKLEEGEERRKARESKRLAKEVQSRKQKERAKQKKDDIDSVKKWRKQRQKSNFADDDSGAPGLDFEDGGKGFEKKRKLGRGVGPADRSGGRKPGMSRKKRDSKFGFGGRKGSKKQNRAESAGEAHRAFGKIKAAEGNKKRKL